MPLTLDLRLALYGRIIVSGRVPSLGELLALSGLSEQDVVSELRRLQAIHAVALAPASDEILMAHPFSAIPTPYVVRTHEHAFWANCAWDAVSIPSMLGTDAIVEARCADCADPLTFAFREGRLQETDGVVHFTVPPREFWRNVVYT